VFFFSFLRNPRGGIHYFVRVSRRDGFESAGVAPDSASGCRQWGGVVATASLRCTSHGRRRRRDLEGSISFCLSTIEGTGATANASLRRVMNARGNVN